MKKTMTSVQTWVATYLACATNCSSSAHSIQLIRREIVTGVRANRRPTSQPEMDRSSTQDCLLNVATFARRYRTYNYAGKLDWVINPNHQLTFSIFRRSDENESFIVFVSEHRQQHRRQRSRLRHSQLGSALQRFVVANLDSELIVQPGQEQFQRNWFRRREPDRNRNFPSIRFVATTPPSAADSLSPPKAQTGSGTSTPRRSGISGDNTRRRLVTRISARSIQEVVSAVVLASRFHRRT